MTTDRSVYLDHAATTPMHPAAIEAMTAVLATVGNASSLHGTGRIARRRMEESRETLAKLLGARPSEVVFTAGGTESDNLAVKGIYWARRDAEPRRRRIVTTEGAVWVQIDNEVLAPRPKAGSKLEIKRAALGSYVMKVDGHRPIRVRRSE